MNVKKWYEAYCLNPFKIPNPRTLKFFLKNIANQLGLSDDYLMSLICTKCCIRVPKETNLETSIYYFIEDHN